jgi:4-hydroxyacetophenone monooxygenase
MISTPVQDTSLDADALTDALGSANLPTLLAVLFQLTGEERWLADPYRPGRRFGMDPNDSGGFDPEIQAEIRTAAHAAIMAWSNGRAPEVARPTGDLLIRLMSLIVSEDVPAEYEEMLAEQMGFAAHADAHAVHERDPDFLTVIIGAGLGGLMAAIRLKQAGIPFTVLERSGHAGGVWWENRYPGAGVDTPSYLYSYSFFPRNWSTFFARREELVSYIDDVVEEFELAPSLQLGVEVTSARFDEDTQKWTIVANRDGKVEQFEANALVSAVGIFSQPKVPDLPGMDTFEGPIFHSARWPKDLDVSGKRVALVGTGASSMQILPAIVDSAQSLTVFQRSPAWVTPVSNYFDAVPESVHWLIDHVPYYHSWYRFSLAWTFNDKLHPTLQVDPNWSDPDHSINKANARQRAGMTSYIVEQLSDRPDLQEKTIPNYPPWGKRMLIDNGWYAALKRPHVELITESVEEITQHGVVTASGERRDADVVVFSTGFEANRYLFPLKIEGRDGLDLREVWEDDNARAYLGITAPGFPNLFFVYGPNTNGSGGSFLAWSESQVRYIVQVIEGMIEHRLGAVEPRQDLHDEYNARVDDAHSRMIWTHPKFTTYYRNARGRVVVNVPWRVVDYWRMLRKARLSDFVTTPVHPKQKRKSL